MDFRCKFSNVDELEWRLRGAVKDPMHEVQPTEESLGWGRSMVCESDCTVYVPAIGLFFRNAVEYEYNKEHDDIPIEGILHCYR